MVSAKEQVRKVLDEMPENCTVEEIQYQLYVVEKIRARSEMADRGEFISQEEAERHLSKWLK